MISIGRELPAGKLLRGRAVVPHGRPARAARHIHALQPSGAVRSAKALPHGGAGRLARAAHQAGRCRAAPAAVAGGASGPSRCAACTPASVSLVDYRGGGSAHRAAVAAARDGRQTRWRRSAVLTYKRLRSHGRKGAADEFMLNMSITWNACGSAGTCQRPSLVQMAYGREQPVCFLAMFMGR